MEKKYTEDLHDVVGILYCKGYYREQQNIPRKESQMLQR